MSRRLLFLAPNLEQGGAERLWANLLPGLAAAGHRVRCVTLDGRGPFFEALREAGIDARCAELAGPADLVGLRRARALCADPEVIISRPVSATALGTWVARGTGAIHLFNEHRGSEIPYSPRRERLMHLLGPRLDGAIAISSAQIPQLGRYGINPATVRIVANGVPAASQVDPAKRRDPEMRHELGAEKSQFVALLVATLRPEKRVELFVEAIAAAAQRDPRVVGVVVGDGPDRGRAEATAQRLAAPVRFLGARGDAAELIAAADCLALSSDSEGVPMVILEAMAAGRAVVATAVGAIGEAVIDGETGLLVAPGQPGAIADGLLRLSADPVLATRLGTNARARHAARFSLPTLVGGYESAITEALLASSDSRSQASRNAPASRPLSSGT